MKDLMQNCDLPQPMKVFMGSDNKTVVSSMNYRMESGDNRDKLEVLKALRLSQTRAREAEKRAEALEKERDRLSEALLDEAKHLFAHRHWVRLLDLQVSTLKAAKRVDDNDDDDGACVPWLLALALCFGFAFGCTFFF